MNLYRATAILITAGWLLAACGGPAATTSAPATGAAATAGQASQATPGAAGTAVSTRSAILSEIRSTVEAHPASTAEWISAAEGDQIAAGGGVRTGEQSKVRIETSEGSIIRISANTVFQLAEFSPQAEDPVTKLELASGKVWVWVTKALGAGSFEVETPNGVATVRGSLMSVEHDLATGRTLVTCAEGECTLSDRARQAIVALREGEQTEIAAGGPGPLAARRMTRQQLRAWLDEFPEVRMIIQRLLDRAGPDETPTPPGGAGQTACDHAYFPMRPGASWTLASPNGTITWAVASVSGDAAQATAVMNWTIGDVSGTYTWECTPAGLISYDFGALSTTQFGQVATFETTSSSGVWLPAADLLTPGYAWTQAYEMVMSLTAAPGGGAATTGTSSVTSNWQVLEALPVSVGDQTFDGLRVQQELRQVIQVTVGGLSAPATDISTSNTLVYARGVGIVEMSGTDGVTTLVSYTIP